MRKLTNSGNCNYVHIKTSLWDTLTNLSCDRTCYPLCNKLCVRLCPWTRSRLFLWLLCCFFFFWDGVLNKIRFLPLCFLDTFLCVIYGYKWLQFWSVLTTLLLNVYYYFLYTSYFLNRYGMLYRDHMFSASKQPLLFKDMKDYSSEILFTQLL
jgi:hypothetical protein